jgi:hypothetical protein
MRQTSLCSWELPSIVCVFFVFVYSRPMYSCFARSYIVLFPSFLGVKSRYSMKCVPTVAAPTVAQNPDPFLTD